MHTKVRGEQRRGDVRLHGEGLGTSMFTQRGTDTDVLTPPPRLPKPRDTALLAKAVCNALQN